MKKNLPLDVSNIVKMITDGYIYVDKTKQIYELITRGNLYFLSRPRRFGKSLFISTLREIFLGNRQLFQNLWIGKSDYEWPKHPVIELDFSQLSYKSADALTADLSWTLESIAEKHGFSIASAPSLVTKLSSLVDQLSKIGSVVILIDEYDYPLLRTLHTPETAKPLRDELSAFFAAMKGCDSKGLLRAIFITGVTKFSKTSIFSGMNILNDISLDSNMATLLGYTEEEIQNYFKKPIALFSENKKIPIETLMKEMKEWYNGYKFSENNHEQKVYNPFSILYYLQKQKLENYWFESGTPSFLIELVKKHYLPIDYHKALETTTVSHMSLGAFDVETELPLTTLLFQTGYLTIKSYNSELRAYILGFPNQEVRLSLSLHLMALSTHRNSDQVNLTIFSLLSALHENDINAFCQQLQVLFATIPYDYYLKKEAYFHSLFHLLTTLLGLDIQSEIHTSVGRIDLTLKTKGRIFVFEFKFGHSGQEALQQIEELRYYERYLSEKKPITLVGLSFNIDDKKLTLDWLSKDFLA